MYKFFLLLLSIMSFCSCEQFVRSVASEAANSQLISDSLAFEHNEKPIALERYDVVERKKVGKDSLFLVRGYFLNGKTYYESWYKNDRADGISTFYTEKGKVHYQLSYVNGFPHTLISSFDLTGKKTDGGNLRNGSGNMKIYHPITGTLIYEINYLNGLRHGKSNAFFSDGNKLSEMTFVNDTTAGAFVEYYHNGKVSKKGNLDLVTITGLSESYYPNGKPKLYDKWVNGVQIAYKEYDENGFLIKEKTYVDGKLLGTNFYYDSNGKLLSKGQLFNEQKHGNYEYFYETGKRKTLEVYAYDTLLTETIWFENGNLSVQNTFKHGLKHGICKEYYSTGKTRTECNYINDVKSGICKEYYPTGNIRTEQNYVNGVEEGMYKSYFNNGKIYNDGNFKDGELTGDLKFYSEKGELTKTKKYN